MIPDMTRGMWNAPFCKISGNTRGPRVIRDFLTRHKSQVVNQLRATLTTAAAGSSSDPPSKVTQALPSRPEIEIENPLSCVICVCAELLSSLSGGVIVIGRKTDEAVAEGCSHMET